MNDYFKKQIAEIDAKIAEAQKLLTDSQLADLAREEITRLEKEKAGFFSPYLLHIKKKNPIKKNGRFEELDRTEGGIGNIKTVVVKIAGRDVSDKLKFESGVHRVQRIPATESQGRIH